MRRREFIAGLAGAVAWPLVAGAQQTRRPRRIGALMSRPIDDPDSLPRVTAFVQALQGLGWTVGRNLQIDYRWGAYEAGRVRKDAIELVALAPDAMLAESGVVTGVLQEVTRSVPIVFVNAIDPVGAGLVASFARPGGNITGFASYEFGLAAKWLELLKEIAPKVKRVAVLRDPSVPAGSAPYGAIQGVAPSFGVEVVPIDTRDERELEGAVSAFARVANGGLILVAPAFVPNRSLIVALAAHHGLPAIYPIPRFVAAGGLVSYGPDANEHMRGAAGYIDRILKGEKPADLPVQAPTKYLLAVNIKAAKALGLDIPSSLLLRADEVIE
jgi:putative tryptophan/tyrosine transport system substrate-binding protein